MKTIKTILTIVGVALTTITFGQLLSQTDGRILFNTVAFNSVNNRLEYCLDQFEAPMAARTYFVPVETAMAVESWMVSPFECNYYEMELPIESWMTVPFDSGDEVEVEEWMTTSWI